MNKYNTQIEQIKYTQKGKEILMENVKKSNKSKTKVLKIALVVAMLSTITATAYATQNPTDILAPIFGSTQAQTEIIGKIGVPINASDTSNGITITAEAIIGDSKNVNIVYRISNEDGTPYIFEEISGLNEINSVSLSIGKTQKLKSNRPIGTGIYDNAIKIDEYWTFTQKLSINDDTDIIGDTYITSFDKIGVYGDDENIVFEGDWNFKLKLDFLDSTEVIDVNQDFNFNDAPHTLNSIRISPISMNLYYTAYYEELVEVTLTPYGQINIDLPVIITKKDGSNFDSFNSSLSQNRDGTADKNITFDKILPLEEIASIQIEDIIIDVDF